MASRGASSLCEEGLAEVVLEGVGSVEVGTEVGGTVAVAEGVDESAVALVEWVGQQGLHLEQLAGPREVACQATVREGRELMEQETRVGGGMEGGGLVEAATGTAIAEVSKVNAVECADKRKGPPEA